MGILYLVNLVIEITAVLHVTKDVVSEFIHTSHDSKIVPPVPTEVNDLKSGQISITDCIRPFLESSILNRQGRSTC